MSPFGNLKFSSSFVNFEFFCFNVLRAISWSNPFKMITLSCSPDEKNNECENTSNNGTNKHVVSLLHSYQEESNDDCNVKDEFFSNPNVKSSHYHFSFFKIRVCSEYTQNYEYYQLTKQWKAGDSSNIPAKGHRFACIKIKFYSLLFDKFSWCILIFITKTSSSYNLTIRTNKFLLSFTNLVINKTEANIIDKI